MILSTIGILFAVFLEGRLGHPLNDESRFVYGIIGGEPVAGGYSFDEIQKMAAEYQKQKENTQPPNKQPLTTYKAPDCSEDSSERSSDSSSDSSEDKPYRAPVASERPYRNPHYGYFQDSFRGTVNDLRGLFNQLGVPESSKFFYTPGITGGSTITSGYIYNSQGNSSGQLEEELLVFGSPFGPPSRIKSATPPM